jgi:hypothetical protein
MARFFNSLLLGSVLALVGSACGSSDTKKTETATDITTLAPADNQVSGWIGDTTNLLTNGVPTVATNKTDAVNLIDGSADAFFDNAFVAKALVFNRYVNTTNPAALLTINHKVWQMASAADCVGIYDWLRANSPTYMSQPWQDVAGLGDVARESNMGGTIRFNICKGAYLVETDMQGDDTAAGETTLRAFVDWVLAKIP